MSIYSRKNPPPGYYVYLYLRDDGTPYYAGKGKGIRAWSKTHTVSPPKDLTKIIFPAVDLLEMWSLALERRFIRWYGRKDLGTGILHNRTDGGDGVAGIKPSMETIEKRRQSNLGKKRSEEYKQKMSELMTGKPSWHKGRTKSEETKARMREGNKTRVPITEETRQRMREAHIGHKPSLETIEKRKISLKLAWKRKKESTQK